MIRLPTPVFLGSQAKRALQSTAETGSKTLINERQCDLQTPLVNRKASISERVLYRNAQERAKRNHRVNGAIVEWDGALWTSVRIIPRWGDDWGVGIYVLYCRAPGSHICRLGRGVRGKVNTTIIPLTAMADLHRCHLFETINPTAHPQRESIPRVSVFL